MKSFTFFEEYYELITLLEEEEQKELIYAIVRFMFEDIEPTLNTRETKIFNNLKRPLIISKNKSNSKLNKIKTKSNKNQIENKKKSNQKQTTQVVTKSMSMSMSNINNKYIFNKPSIEEIKEYCIERNNNINPESFYDFYESKNWMVGKNKMKDWKACIRTWESRTKKEDLPEWYKKEYKKEELSEEELKEMEELMKGFK